MSKHFTFFKKRFPLRLKKLWSLFSRREKKKTLLLFGLMCISALAEMVSIGAIPAFILIVASPEKVLAHPLPGPIVAWLGVETGRELLVTGSVGLILLFVLKGLLVAGINYIRIRFAHHKYIDLSGRLFTSYMLAPFTFHLNRNTSGLLRNLISESHTTIHGVFMPLLGLALNVANLFFILALLVLIEPLFTLIALSLLGSLTYLMIRTADKKMGWYGAQELHHRQISNKVVLEGLSGLKDVRVLGREEGFLSQFAESNYRRAESQFYREMVQNIQRPLLETITVIGVLGLALVLTAQDQSIESIVAILALFAAATYRMMPTFREMIYHINSLHYHIVSIDPVYDDLQALAETLEKRITPDKPPLLIQKEVVVDNLSFAYSRQPVLKNVSLRIPKGGAVALVGESGAGKTTLADMLLGLFKPASGSIRVDGKDIFDNLRSWQRNTGYIPQSIYLSDDSLKNNVGFGLKTEDVCNDLFWPSVQAAGLTELIDSLPDKENTHIGEHGIRLSGGQRQRIGIARALYHNPQFLIMDEGTSALDNITEQFIIEAIEQLRGERTIIMIAHRISTVKKCDTIFLMEHGQITDQGNYEELLNRNELFRQMAEGSKASKQAGSFIK